MAATGEAQTLRGRVVDEQLETPVLVGAALLLDSAGRTIHGAITDTAGVFTLTLPGPGLYRIRVDVAGYATLLVPPFDVGRNEIVEFVVRVGHYESWVDPMSIRRREEPDLRSRLRRRR